MTNDALRFTLPVSFHSRSVASPAGKNGMNPHRDPSGTLRSGRSVRRKRSQPWISWASKGIGGAEVSRAGQGPDCIENCHASQAQTRHVALYRIRIFQGRNTSARDLEPWLQHAWGD